MYFSEECKINKIRHIRCYTSVKNPLEIKKHTYRSNKPYKQKYYADMGDLYVMCKYESSDKMEKEYHVYSLYEISENRKNGLEEVPTTIENKKGTKVLKLSLRLRKGDMLLLYKDSEEGIKEMDNNILSQHLYVIRGFERDGRIILQMHINTQPDKELGKGESIKDYNNMPKKIRCGINSIKFLTCDIDFKITNHGIIFLNKS